MKFSKCLFNGFTCFMWRYLSFKNRVCVAKLSVTHLQCEKNQNKCILLHLSSSTQWEAFLTLSMGLFSLSFGRQLADLSSRNQWRSVTKSIFVVLFNVTLKLNGAMRLNGNNEKVTTLFENDVHCQSFGQSDEEKQVNNRTQVKNPTF